MAFEGYPESLRRTESGGNWNALNNELGAGGAIGHGGRLQFGQARLADAARAGIVPLMTPQEFSRQRPEVQIAVEDWHFDEINRRATNAGFERYLGQNINGVTMTPQSIQAVAHLGGFDGARRYLETGGRYNPADSFGTSLADYARTHSGSAPAGNSQPPNMPGGVVGQVAGAASQAVQPLVLQLDPETARAQRQAALLAARPQMQPNMLDPAAFQTAPRQRQNAFAGFAPGQSGYF